MKQNFKQIKEEWDTKDYVSALEISLHYNDPGLFYCYSVRITLFKNGTKHLQLGGIGLIANDIIRTRITRQAHDRTTQRGVCERDHNSTSLAVASGLLSGWSLTIMKWL